MSNKDATLNKRGTGLVMSLLPARALRKIGFKIMMNAVGKSHRTPNNKIRPAALSLVTPLLRISRIANGNIRIRLMSAADVKSLVMVLMFFPTA